MKSSPIYTVSQIANQIKFTFERDYQSIFIKGEISTFKIYESGHAYFTIKDNNSEVNCVYFNCLNNLTYQTVKNIEVIIFGSINFYKKKGRVQVVVTDIHFGKDGDIWHNFLILKNKLSKEGLFNDEHKKKLPLIPENIAIISSKQGAVIHDIENIIKRRAPFINIHFFNTSIQGDKSILSISDRIKEVNKNKKINLIILTRGGGSFEDLNIFNTEIIVRSIFASKIPVLTAIGHQTDVTLSDFAADKSASTPSEAGEICSPSTNELLMKLNLLDNRRINIFKNYIFKYKDILNTYTLKISLKTPKLFIEKMKDKLAFQKLVLNNNIKKIISNYNAKLKNMNYILNNYNINELHKRGFSIIRKKGKIINSIKDIKIKDNISIKLFDGNADSTIIAINEKK